MSAKPNTFTFRLNSRDRQLVEALAERLQRTRSDAVRFVLREAARSLELSLTGEATMESARDDEASTV